MSMRELRLCDMPGWRDGVKCDGVAIGTCQLCDRDMCDRHAMHPKKGMALKIESWKRDNTPTPPRDLPWSGQTSQSMPPDGWVFPSDRIAVCTECRTQLDTGHIDNYRSPIIDVLNSLMPQFVDSLRAKLAELALKKENKDK